MIPFRFTKKNVLDVLGHPRWMIEVLARYMATTGMPRYENYSREMQQSITAKPMGRSQVRNDSMTWEDVRTLRKLWSGPLMVKGVLHPQDAILAADNGADAVIVSNHGGRNFDATPAPIDVLPSIVDAAGRRLAVILSPRCFPSLASRWCRRAASRTRQSAGSSPRIRRLASGPDSSIASLVRRVP